ncbi:reverse transcriptase domain-containing protein [Tanacetum coccineum]
MAEGDEDKTAFFAGEGVFCYRTMPFGLKNAGATYQRLVDKVFYDQIGRNLEAYVDDMVIKSTFEEEMLADIKETFEKFRSINMKLNPKKYKKNIQWTQEAEATLQEMKKFMEILLTLTTPVQGEILMMYLTASTKSISAALFAKREKEQQGGYEGEHDIVFQERGDETPKDFLIEVPIEDNKKEAEEKANTKPMKTKLRCEWKLFTDRAVSFDDSDLQLLVNQIKGTYAAKQPMIREYLQKTKEALKDFDSYTIEHIQRNQNKKADALSKMASMTFEHLTKEVLVKVLPKRSIEEKEILQVETKEGESWMTLIHEYLVSGLLPEDPKESRKIRVKVPQYKLIRGNLYRRSFYTLWLHYVASPQTDDIVKEVHEDLYKGLKVTQSFSPIIENMEIMNHIEKQLARSKQGWVDDLAQVLWVHRTLPRNSQKETSFSLTYGSEAIIPISENDVAKDDRGRIKEVDKRRGSKEIASIKEAYYRSKLHRHHNKRSSHPIYKIGDFVLLS